MISAEVCSVEHFACRVRRQIKVMGGGPDLDMWLEKIRACEVLAEDELKLLCEYVRSRDSEID